MGKLPAAKKAGSRPRFDIAPLVKGSAVSPGRSKPPVRSFDPRYSTVMPHYTTPTSEFYTNADGSGTLVESAIPVRIAALGLDHLGNARYEVANPSTSTRWTYQQAMDAAARIISDNPDLLEQMARLGAGELAVDQFGAPMGELGAETDEFLDEVALGDVEMTLGSLSSELAWVGTDPEAEEEEEW